MLPIKSMMIYECIQRQGGIGNADDARRAIGSKWSWYYVKKLIDAGLLWHPQRDLYCTR